MNPQERDLINGLFDRLRQAEGQPRDAEAEALIRDRISQQAAAAYALCQTAIVQEHTITALQSRVQELEARLAQPAPQQGGGGFLSGLFGGGASARPAAPQPMPQAAPAAGPWGGAPQAQPAPAGPWGSAPAQAPSAGGGFLATAVTTAAGVAGGMLVANAISSMFSGHGGGGASQSLFGGNSGAGSSNDAFSQIQPGGSAPSQPASDPAYDSGAGYDSADDGDTFDSGFDDSSDYA